MRRERRRVLRPYQRDRVALQAIDRQRTADGGPLRHRLVWRHAKLRSGGPERTAAGQRIGEAQRIVAVAKRDAAIAVLEIGRKSDGVAADRLPEEWCRR